MLFFLFISLAGTAAIAMSILAWRLKNKQLFGLSFIPLGLVIICGAPYYNYILIAIMGGELLGIVFLAFLVIPIIFLIKFKMEEKNGPSISETNSYLDDIIEADDEEIDFE